MSTASITLCEFAAVHADKTFSVIRGGINHWTVTALPTRLNIVVLVQILPGFSVGAHGVVFRILSPAEKLMIEINLNLMVTDRDEVLAASIPVPIEVTATGRYRFVIVDKQGDSIGSTALDIRWNTPKN